MTCVSETWDGENNRRHKTVTRSPLHTGRPRYDDARYDESGRATCCEAGQINDDARAVKEREE